MFKLYHILILTEQLFNFHVLKFRLNKESTIKIARGDKIEFALHTSCAVEVASK